MDYCAVSLQTHRNFFVWTGGWSGIDWWSVNSRVGRPWGGTHPKRLARRLRVPVIGDAIWVGDGHCWPDSKG